MYGEAVIITLARIERENVDVVCSNCISVTDDIKINEQNEFIGNGPLYLKTEFVVLLSPNGGFEPCGVWNVAILAGSKCKAPKCILSYRNGVV